MNQDFTVKKSNICLKKKFVQGNSPGKKIPAQAVREKKNSYKLKIPHPPAPHHFSNGPSLIPSLGYLIYHSHGPLSLNYGSKLTFLQFIRMATRVQLLIIGGFHYYLLLGGVKKEYFILLYMTRCLNICMIPIMAF